MLLNNFTNNNFITKQLKLPLEIEKIIDISDPVYTFCDVMNHIDLKSYFAGEGCKTGRPRCGSEKLLKVILFAFMQNGISSLRELERLCKTDIRFMYLLDGLKAPSHATFGNFIRNELSSSIEQIFNDINSYIFEVDNVDLEHTYIDGTKIEANANRYTWVWKRSCIKNRDKVFDKISTLIDEMNSEVLNLLGVRLEKRDEYAVDYVQDMLANYKKYTGLDTNTFVSGKGHRKSVHQRQYQKMLGYMERLKGYANHIEICGDSRNSYSKTDYDATFMRVKRDYMGNDQLLPAYNIQVAICDEYIAVIDAKKYASHMECFVPLMEKFNDTYGNYPKYSVADAGYGSYNNYIYCEEHCMEKFMKFTMFEKETKHKKYRDNPYRAINFLRDKEGNLICPNGKKFIFKYEKKVRKNKYGRTEEIYECEDCEGCPHRSECCKRTTKNRTISLNRELTSMHEEVISNLESVHGALLCMNRSIQAEGTFGIIKWNRSYKRLFRRGLDNVILELTLISCGYNLYKYNNKLNREMLVA